MGSPAGVRPTQVISRAPARGRIVFDVLAISARSVLLPAKSRLIAARQRSDSFVTVPAYGQSPPVGPNGQRNEISRLRDTPLASLLHYSLVFEGDTTDEAPRIPEEPGNRPPQRHR